MLRHRIRVIGLQLLILTQFTHALVLLTANLEDVKKLVRKFVPATLADQIAELLSKTNYVNTPNISEENEKNADNMQQDSGQTDPAIGRSNGKVSAKETIQSIVKAETQDGSMYTKPRRPRFPKVKKQNVERNLDEIKIKKNNEHPKENSGRQTGNVQQSYSKKKFRKPIHDGTKMRPNRQRLRKRPRPRQSPLKNNPAQQVIDEGVRPAKQRLRQKTRSRKLRLASAATGKRTTPELIIENVEINFDNVNETKLFNVNNHDIGVGSTDASNLVNSILSNDEFNALRIGHPVINEFDNNANGHRSDSNLLATSGMVTLTKTPGKPRWWEKQPPKDQQTDVMEK